MAVAVVFAVGFVVAVHVAHQVHQGEAVVGGEDVHAAVGGAVAKHSAGAGQRVGQLAGCAGVAQPGAALGVAVAVVPFQPAGGKRTQLVAAVANVPGLGNHQAVAQQRVLRHGHEEWRTRLKADMRRLAARQNGGEVKPETVDTEVCDPTAQAVHHQAQHQWLVQVEHIAAAGPVDVARAVVRQQVVVQRVVDAAQRQRGAGFVGLGRVVEHHIQHHLKAGGMQRIDHGTAFVAGVFGGAGVAVFRRGPAYGVVAPVVAQAQLQQARFVGPLRQRHQAHGGDAQALQVGDGRGVRQAGVGAAQRLGHTRVQRGEGLQVQFVQHAAGRVDLRPRGLQRGRVCQRKGFERGGGVVARVGLRGVVGAVAQVDVVAVVAAQHLAGIRVQQQLGGVETLALGRVPGAVHPVAVHRAGRQAGHEAAPDALRVDGQSVARGAGPASAVKHTQFHTVRVGCRQGEMHPLLSDGGAERIHAFKRASTGLGSTGARITQASGGRLITKDWA